MATTSTIDKECNKILLNTFFRNIGCNLRKGNNYQQLFLEPKLEELDARVKEMYPEHYQSFKIVKEDFLEQFRAMNAESTKSNRNNVIEAAEQAK